MRRRAPFLAVLALSLPLQAQDLADYLSKYTSANGKGYLQPLADAFGANMNSGLYYGARIEKFGLHIRVGLETMTALIADDQKVFTAKTEDPFSPAATAEAPTVFGSTKGTSATGTGNTIFNFPGGLGLSKVPILLPQVTVGSILGTEATLRFVQVNVNDDFGKIKLFGFGLRHSISQYLGKSPVDLAAAFFVQKFEVGDIVEANAKYYGLQASLSRSIFTFYGGAGFESANLDIAYTFEPESGSAQTIAFDLEAENSARFTIGLALNLLLAQVHADYNFGAQKVLAMGVGFGL